MSLTEVRPAISATCSDSPRRSSSSRRGSMSSSFNRSRASQSWRRFSLLLLLNLPADSAIVFFQPLSHICSNCRSADSHCACVASYPEDTVSKHRSVASPGKILSAKTERPPKIGGRCLCYTQPRYFRLPLESIVIPPGPLSFFSSLALRVPMALVRHSSACARSALRAASLPKSRSALRR